MRRWSVPLCLMFAFAGPAAAKPLDPGQKALLLGLVDRYDHEMAAGHAKEAFALRAVGIREMTAGMMRSDADWKQLAEAGKQNVPDSVTFASGSINESGNNAEMTLNATKIAPPESPAHGGPPAGTKVNAPMNLTFVREADGWKIDDLSLGPRPARIAVKACDDTSNEPGTAFSENATANLGGTILRVDFEPDHVGIVMSGMDEENCILIKLNKEQLKAHGLNPDLIGPGSRIEVEAIPHKTNGQKYLAYGITIQSRN